VTVASSLGALSALQGGTAALLRVVASLPSSARGRIDPSLPVARRAVADLRLPCMLYAAVGSVPFREGRIPPEDLERARRTPGVAHMLPLASLEGFAPGVAVIARGRFLARQVLDSLTAQWNLACFGKAAAALTGTPAPAPEPCTAQTIDGRLRVWAPTLAADGADVRLRERIARIAGMDASLVEVSSTGQGVVADALLVPAIALAKALQPAPVQLLAAALLPLQSTPQPNPQSNSQSNSQSPVQPPVDAITPPPRQTSPEYSTAD
jgi:hypothetical protein